MDPNQFVDSVREENRTALSRIGSSEALSDEGEMGTDDVLRAAADSAFHARESFEQWADSEGNETARETYATTATEEGEYYGQLTQRLDGEHEPDETSSLYEYLRDTADTAGRAGAFVGWTIVIEEANEQLVSFFTDRSETTSVDLLDDLGDDADTQHERGRDLLLAVCETDDEWARAGETAGDTIQAATPLF